MRNEEWVNSVQLFVRLASWESARLPVKVASLSATELVNKLIVCMTGGLTSSQGLVMVKVLKVDRNEVNVQMVKECVLERSLISDSLIVCVGMTLDSSSY